MIGCFFASKPPPEVAFLLRVLDCSDLLTLADLYGEARDGLKSPEMMEAVNKRMAEITRTFCQKNNLPPPKEPSNG